MAGVVGLLAVLVGAVVWVASDVPEVAEADVELTEDFSTGAGAFAVFDEPDMAGQSREGGYWLTGREADSTFWAAARMTPADVVDLRATVQLTAGAAPDAAAGIVVLRGDDDGYALALDGRGQLVLLRTTSDEDEPVQTRDAPATEGPTTLRLTVRGTFDVTEVAGYVDGRQVLTFEDSRAWDQFDGVGVYAMSAQAPVEVRADDVVVKTAG